MSVCSRRALVKPLSINIFETGLLILFIPFFKLLSFNMFQEQGFHSTFFYTLGYSFDIGRIIASTIGILLFIYGKKKLHFKSSRITITILLVFIIMTLSCILNKSIDTKLLMKTYTYIGFILLLDYALKKSVKSVFKVAKIYFGILALLGALTTILFPLGFLHGSTVYNAVYLFGGKNASFPFFYIFLLSSYLLNQLDNDTIKLPRFWYVSIALMIISVILCDSANSLIALIAIIIITLLSLIAKPKINALIPTTLYFVTIVIIYLGNSIPQLEGLLELMGRDSTFSYRTLLWKQAILYIISFPFFGAGYNISFSLGTIHTDHTHSTFLDLFAKYGVITLIAFMVMIIVVYKDILRIKYKPLGFSLGMFFLIYLFYIGFNDYNYNFIILTIMLLHGFSNEISNLQCQNYKNRKDEKNELKKV